MAPSTKQYVSLPAWFFQKRLSGGKSVSLQLPARKEKEPGATSSSEEAMWLLNHVGPDKHAHGQAAGSRAPRHSRHSAQPHPDNRRTQELQRNQAASGSTDSAASGLCSPQENPGPEQRETREARTKEQRRTEGALTHSVPCWDLGEPVTVRSSGQGGAAPAQGQHPTLCSAVSTRGRERARRRSTADERAGGSSVSPDPDPLGGQGASSGSLDPDPKKGKQKRR